MKFDLVDYNPTIDEPDYWAIKGWNSSLLKADIDCDICFFGHSQVEMSDFRDYFPDKKIMTLGYPGDNIKGMLRRVPQIKAVHPEVVVLIAGVNSIKMPEDKFEKSFSELLDSILGNVPETKILVCSMLPERDGSLGIAEMNKTIIERNCIIQQLSDANGLDYVDLYTPYSDEDGLLLKEVTLDGIHLQTSDAYNIFANVLKQKLDS